MQKEIKAEKKLRTLKLSRETLRQLDDDEFLHAVNGGLPHPSLFNPGLCA